MNPATLEVYASTVQPYQIKALLPISDHTEENINKEREQFLNWLTDMWINNVTFEHQSEAWETYTLYIDYDLFDDYEAEGSYWEEEIETILDSKIEPMNYNEFRGQQ